MKLRFLPFCIVVVIILFSCSDEESRSCTFCSSDLTPEFELCREGNGNASANGEDTGTDYDVYLSDLQESGVNCQNE